MLIKIFRLAAQGYNMIVASVAEAIAKLKGGEVPGRIMVIVRSPVVAVLLWEAGIDHWPQELNIGALGGKPNARQLNSSTYLLPQEVEAVEKLSQKGVRVSFQMVPGTRRQDWENVRSKLC